MTFWNTKRVELALDRHVKSAVSLAMGVGNAREPSVPLTKRTATLFL